MTWHQLYNPLDSLGLSALVAAIPVVVLLGLLGFTHLKAHLAAMAGLLAALLLALVVYRMPPPLVAASAGYGAAYGLFPIGWIVLNAIFLYDITVATGQFEIVKRSIAGLAGDRRIQALFIAFSFGAFIEGAAGFGTPVAISAAMLIGLGFRPLPAAGLALIGNTAPVAFGALGSPLLALSKVTGLDLQLLSSMVGRQLPVFSLIVPFWLVTVLSGWRGMREVWPACLVAGGSFALAQFTVSNYHGPWLVDIIGSGVSMLSLSLLLRFWQPKTEWRFPHERHQTPEALVPPSRRQALTAWMPWSLLSLLVFLWGLPPVKDALNGFSAIKIPIPALDGAVFRVPPVVPAPRAEEAVFVLNLLSATGTALLFAAILSGLLLGLRPQSLFRLYGKTFWRVRWSLLTIALMLSLGFTTRYSGSDTTMGLAFASTGALFPFFSPLLGWLGVALTGSDTSSNVLFGNLQQVAAHQVGISPVLAAASNSSGGVMGKMIDAQSIVVASVATGGDGDTDEERTNIESATPREILRFVFPHSLALAVLVGLLVLLQAYVLSGYSSHSTMKIGLFIPCFVDTFYPQVGIHIVEILERLGHTVTYPDRVTCCGQPAFNAGFWPEARTVARRVLSAYTDCEAVVVASGSCGAMLTRFYPQIFEKTPDYAAALALSDKTWEFSDFLVTKLGVTDLGARFPAKITFHDGCHGLRELGIQSQPRTLLAHVRDLEMVEMVEAQTCCGFGGLFAVKFSSISTAMGEVKCASAIETGADYIVSNDSSCLMHIQGLLNRQGQPLQCLHLAEVLAKREG